MPAVPREGEPVMVTFKLNNPSPRETEVAYRFYAGGELLHGGTALVPALSSKPYQFVYASPLELGRQVNFLVEASSALGESSKSVSLPAYPPQVWSSFVSFASFSTSVMSSMSTMTYYNSTFGSQMGLNVGLIASIVLIALLVFLELSQPAVMRRTVAALGRLRINLSGIAWILLIVFLGIVYTRIVMAIATLSFPGAGS
jgi:hypothetical protein